MKKIRIAAVALLLGLLATPIADCVSVHTVQVTIGAGTTQVVSANTYCRQIIFQNNAANDMHVGDSNTSATRGALLKANSVGSMNLGPFDIQSLNLNEYYVNGTAADKLDVIYID